MIFMSQLIYTKAIDLTLWGEKVLLGVVLQLDEPPNEIGIFFKLR